MLKNSIKVLFGNLTTTWKILLYKLITIIFVIGLTSALILPIIKALIEHNFFSVVSNEITNLTFNVNIENLVTSLNLVLTKFWQIIVAGNLQALAIISIIIFVLVYYFVTGLYRLAVAECLNGYMGSFAKISFINAFVGNFKNSILFALARIVTELPITIIIVFVGALLFTSINVLGIATLITIIYFIIALSLSKSLFAGWECAIVKNNQCVFTALVKSIKVSKTRFFKTLSDNIVIMLFVLVVCLLMIFFTVGAGLIVTLPLLYMFKLCYGFVLYYDCSGTRYYLDSNNIFTPKKLEEYDKFKKVEKII